MAHPFSCSCLQLFVSVKDLEHRLHDMEASLHAERASSELLKTKIIGLEDEYRRELDNGRNIEDQLRAQMRDQARLLDDRESTIKEQQGRLEELRAQILARSAHFEQKARISSQILVLILIHWHCRRTSSVRT